MTALRAIPVPSHDTRPTFVGIGAQKCASTWLHRILQAHPEVCVPVEKELDFFSHRYDRGFQWYESQFAHAGPRASARGEISPSYFHEPAVPARVARYLPEAKILVSLRDPVERALSNHRHEVRVGNVTGDLSFERGLTNNPGYVEQGLYATHLRHWLRHFPLAQVHVVLVDDVARDAAAVAAEVFRMLGVDDRGIDPVANERYNVSYVPRSRGLATLKDALYSATRGPAMRRAWDLAAGLGLRPLYRRFNQAPSRAVIPPPRPETIAWLHARFEPELCALEDLLGRSLQAWRARAGETREVA